MEEAARRKLLTLQKDERSGGYLIQITTAEKDKAYTVAEKAYGLLIASHAAHRFALQIDTLKNEPVIKRDIAFE